MQQWFCLLFVSSDLLTLQKSTWCEKLFLQKLTLLEKVDICPSLANNIDRCNLTGLISLQAPVMNVSLHFPEFRPHTSFLSLADVIFANAQLYHLV